MVFDVGFNRVPVPNLPALIGHSVHRPATLNVLFARHSTQERESPAGYAYRQAEQPVNPQTVLKTAIVFEAYGLREWAAYLLSNFAGEVGAVVDVEKAVAKLGASALKRWKWRITTALRALNPLRRP
jgi:hypothetical protein